MTVQTIQSEQARTNWRRLLDLAGTDTVDVIIERHGKPTVAVIGYESYQVVQAMLEERRAGKNQLTEQGGVMAAILAALAALPALSGVGDPVAWQREQRQDHPLPGREV